MRGAVFIIFIHCRARGREYIKTAVVRSQFCESRKYLAACDEGKRVEATSGVWRSIKHVGNCLFQPGRPNLHFIYPVGYMVHSSESAATFSLSSAVFQGSNFKSFTKSSSKVYTYATLYVILAVNRKG